MNEFELVETFPYILHISHNDLGNYSILANHYYGFSNLVRVFYKYGGMESIILSEIIEPIYVSDDINQLTEIAIEKAKKFCEKHYVNVAPKVSIAIDFDNKI